MSQDQRDRAMKGFRNGRHDILVATDIAARGIDVANVSHVINFDLPSTPDAYTHRIGRTGRSELAGKAITFVTREDGDGVRAIERKLGSRIPWSDFGGLAPAPEDGRRGDGSARHSRAGRGRRVSRGPEKAAPTGSRRGAKRISLQPVASRVSMEPPSETAPLPFGSGIDAPAAGRRNGRSRRRGG